MTLAACILLVLGTWWEQPKLVAFGLLLCVIGLAMIYTRPHDDRP